MGIFRDSLTTPADFQLPKSEPAADFNQFAALEGIKGIADMSDLRAVVSQPNKAGIPTPNLTHRVLSKMTFGPSDSLVSYVESLAGSTEQDRLFAYIDEQLEPMSIDDSTTDAMLNNGFETLNKTRQQLYQEHVRRPDGADIPWEYHVLPARETTAACFLRGVNSNRQLLEMMADFWHNHFNVDGWSDMAPGVFVHYDRDVIRANALGNIRQMIYDVTRSTAMLSYLGNAVNQQSAPNENFARELLELHTIGAANYLGHMDWADVPVDAQGRRVGYVEEDVLELARALTGWSFSGAYWRDYQGTAVATGLFLYRDDWHDQGSKRVMGSIFSHDVNDPEKDLNDILDMLAEHPATANFIAEKLCRRFISDSPSSAIVAQVADSLQQNWQAPDQIKQAMEVLLKSSEFLNTWGEKIKRPLEKIISAYRQVNYQFDFNPSTTEFGTFFWAFNDSGQQPFSWTSPNGYPDVKSHWLGSSSTMMTWRYVQWTMGRHQNGDDTLPKYQQILSQTLAHFSNPADITANSLVDFWFQKACGCAPDTQTQDRLAYFMSLNRVWDNATSSVIIVETDRDATIDITQNEWGSYHQERLYTMVTLILLTAEFNYR